MSKERLKEVDDWLISMKEILSLKTDEKEIEEIQLRIDLFEWLREQAYLVHGGEMFTGYKEQNKRYREFLEELKIILWNEGMQSKLGEQLSRKLNSFLEESE